MAATRAPEKAATGESPRPSLSPRGLRSRAAIVDAAATMMRQSGVASTSLDDVLAAAGCGKSQLYHYFDDRADLIRAVIDRQVELILAAQPAILSVTGIAVCKTVTAVGLRVRNQRGTQCYL
ncbi:HTH-type transcriptional regulator [Mycolicibacterium fortuitum subsp. acetamidolyticum]|uniref:HTH-type transcriptional regulator n=1 Tax=Mycolicibacterium fortuitum subsp. acetamidolyticum TaxID=144550 RepID=A0A100WY04_MYCFO|nr:TetR/AcrR family transcriptional regulator [Mycolicibacterium fortuitum]GAT06455.1 HTH-type transcriptional regulator [Mycolicibacterium fortuitum subsp. acetamidolyticum]